MQAEAERWVVTGAGGALGGALVRSLGAEGLSGWRGGAVPDDWMPRLDRAEVVVHAAGPAVADADPDMAADHLALVRALADRGWTGRLVLLSSASVYGEPVRLPVPEEAPLSPVNPYGRFKRAVEAGLAELLPAERLTVLRLANVYGTARDLSRRRVAAVILDALLNGRPFETFGDGTSRRDYLHVDDLCRAVAAARAGPGVMNIGSGAGTSLNALIAACEAVAGRRLDRRRGAERAEAASSVLDVGRARVVLGWRAEVPLEEGLRRLFDSMEAEGRT